MDSNVFSGIGELIANQALPYIGRGSSGVVPKEPITIYNVPPRLVALAHRHSRKPGISLSISVSKCYFYNKDLNSTFLLGHRGGRGEAVENTLPSFAWALISGVTTLELDNGITKDGVPIVWHDEVIMAEKCQDTAPVFAGDPDFPYVGKNIVNLTLSQIKTLDCGSKQLEDYPLQLRYPGTKISTLRELFEFVNCADPYHRILWNIESKVNPVTPGATRSVVDFVTKQYAEFIASGYKPSQITVGGSPSYAIHLHDQAVSKLRLAYSYCDEDDRFPTSALVYEEYLVVDADGNLPWLAGLRLEDFPGSTMGAQIANAAKSIRADVLSPGAFYWNATSHDPSKPGYIPFVTKDMVDEAHQLGMAVIPWSVNRINIADQLVGWGVDGIITDYPGIFHRWAQSKNLKVALTFPEKEVLSCLRKHL